MNRLRRWWNARRQPASVPLVEVHKQAGRLHILANDAGMDALLADAGAVVAVADGLALDRFSGVYIYADTCPCKGTGQ